MKNLEFFFLRQTTPLSMPATRSTTTVNSDNFNVLLWKRFEELKVDLVNKLKALLVAEIKEEIGKFIEIKSKRLFHSSHHFASATGK